MTEPTDEMTTEHRSHRRPGVLLGVATLALLGAVACQAPPSDDPGSGGESTGSGEVTTEPDATPSSDDSTDDATGGTDDDTDGGTGGGAGGGTDAGLPDFSDAVFPECGEAFTLPERTSDLVVEGGPDAELDAYGGAWMTTVTNNGSELVQGQIALHHMIVVDGDGNVVSAPDPDDQLFLGAEGPSWMGVAAGETLDVGIHIGVSCETGDWLPAGDYEAYGAFTFVNSEGDFGEMEQAQGGPWPITIGTDSGEGPAVAPIVPPGAVVADIDCGATWEDPTIDTGYELELIDQIRTTRPVGDDMRGDALVHIAAPIDGMLATQVLILRDGEIVNLMPGSDNVPTASATGGTVMPVAFGTEFYSCDVVNNEPKPLPAGQYEAVVVAYSADQDGTHLLAATDPVAIELT